MTTNTTTTLTFAPPGPGMWERDLSHCPPSATLVYRRVASTTMTEAYRGIFAEWGAPLDTMEVQFVHGKMYRRLVPLVGADRSSAPPPRPVLWLATRLHPAFRRRERLARRALAERPYLDEIAEWHRGERSVWAERNLALQAVDPAELDDAALAEHLLTIDGHVIDGWIRHHQLHGSDLGPIGDLLAHGTRWGLDQVVLLGLLHGASPASCEGRTHGRRIVDALRAAGIDPATVTSLDEVRRDDAASEALDAYLEQFGWRVMTSYDIEGLTIGELPSATCALIRACATEAADAATPDPGPLRERVPAAERPQFDELLADARRAYGMRDDNGPLTAEWPLGLLRRAFLEAGRRLAADGRLDDARHVFELDSTEVAAALRLEPAPSAADAVNRAVQRTREAEAVAPDVLGPALPRPDTSVFPSGIRRVMDIIVAAVDNLEAEPASGDLHGLGIGATTHRGVARVALDPEATLDTMQPGDILVAPWTAPTYNAVLAIAGGIVVQEGGLLSHAAVMARELGIPAVIGCRRAMELIGDGDLIEIDAAAGEVSVVSRYEVLTATT